ncbi:brain-specific angiogenesis inhibitor 1-associated protein 2-like protein 2 [Trichomycterus rosablanca]|uniref:brain-specific angiogenesis inhibitor 1-associated protein 2-like protein 2 n=1 Tax=Trichomycterus rosablanca TaxID=2290929 RepID=UPI002F34F16F
MSGLNTEQLHRSTLGIYMSLMDQFNPGMQRLVALGTNYIQAFQALAETSEAYFSALGKMGEQAMQTMSSHFLGDVLIQISKSQRRLTSELEGVFRWFHNEVLLEMESNIRLDEEYISSSKRRYEMEVRNQAKVLKHQLMRGGSQDGSEHLLFLRESQKEALKEQERRYRFLAEKHCGLTQSIVYLMNKTGTTLQQRAASWREQVNQTRTFSPHTLSGMEDTMVANHLAEKPPDRVPSRGPSPQPTRSRSSSFGESLSGREKIMQALVPYPASSNPTLLSFAKGEMITVLVSEPRNGWLYGRSESSARPGWFPASFVGLIEDTPRSLGTSSISSRSSSMNNLLEQSTSSRTCEPPPTPSSPPTKSNNSRPVKSTSLENKSQKDYGPRPELFPRGTNPFATVKLKPTTTNDRSAPRVF